MRRLTAIKIILLLIVTKAFSQGIDNDNFLITHGPWLQYIDESAVTICWTTNKPAVPGVSLTGPDGKTRFVRNSTDGIVDGGGTLQKVTVDGLAPGVTYKYNVSSVQLLKYQAYKIYYGDTLVRKAETFTTPATGSGKVSFTVFNDVHELAGKMALYLKHNNIAGQDFYFFNGDMVDFLQDPAQLFTGFLDTATTYFAAAKPFFYVRGNHETRGYAARELKNFFSFNEDMFYYSFDWGPVHFTVLDCGEDKPDNSRYYYGLADYDKYRLKELEWLKDEVKSNAFKDAKYRIVMIHMPVIKEVKQNWAMKFLSENFGPLLSNAGINLMISAHIHRNVYYEKGKSGFTYPVLANSNNTFVEVIADDSGIIANVKDVSGKTIAEYNIR
jgi:UDP-2,3-diacylglucosamine pyrophosphatase LpxH